MMKKLNQLQKLWMTKHLLTRVEYYIEYVYYVEILKIPEKSTIMKFFTIK